MGNGGISSARACSRRWAALAAVLVAVAGAGCAGAPRARTPLGEDYVYPVPAPRELSAEESRRLRSAWDQILAGHAGPAQQALLKLLQKRPELVPVRTALGYARLRAGQPAAAAQEFARVLDERFEYVPALVGAGGAALAAGESGAALSFYRRAVDAGAGEARIRRRLAEIKLRVTEERVGAARAALARSDVAAAAEAYRGALEAAPEVAGLRLELAELLVSLGDRPGAMAVLAADATGDRGVGLRLGLLAEEAGDHGGALEAYRRLQARGPEDAEVRASLERVRAALEFERMPAEYRRIFAAPGVTRADLAALLAVQVTPLTRLTPGSARVAVDISGSWARDHIVRLLALEILDVYPNHTFQPGATVRRGDLAQAVSRVLDRLEAAAGAAGPAITDMSPGHLFRRAAERAVGAGLMELTPAGAFEPWRPVSGAEAVRVIGLLARVVSR